MPRLATWHLPHLVPLLHQNWLCLKEILVISKFKCIHLCQNRPLSPTSSKFSNGVVVHQPETSAMSNSRPPTNVIEKNFIYSPSWREWNVIQYLCWYWKQSPWTALPQFSHVYLQCDSKFYQDKILLRSAFKMFTCCNPWTLVLVVKGAETTNEFLDFIW